VIIVVKGHFNVKEQYVVFPFFARKTLFPEGENFHSRYSILQL